MCSKQRDHREGVSVGLVRKYKKADLVEISPKGWDRSVEASKTSEKLESLDFIPDTVGSCWKDFRLVSDTVQINNSHVIGSSHVLHQLNSWVLVMGPSADHQFILLLT